MSELRRRIVSGSIWGAGVLALTIWSFESFVLMCAMAFLILMKEWWTLTKHRGHLWLFLGIGYIGISLFALIALYSLDVRFIFYLFAVVWCGDISAYLVGRKIGKHKIAPTISPGKSWEGLLASMLASSGLSVAVLYLVSTMNLSFVVAIIGALFGLVGLAGDLFESSLKRHAGVKDSGSLIPGHGGLFDRVDALLPCAIFLFFLINIGVWGSH